MSVGGGNIYARYRRAAGLTQERAAELLDCGLRALQRWEAGESGPIDETVLMMVDIYQAPTLAIEHLRSRSAMAAELLPEIERRSLPEAALALLAAIKEFEVGENDLELMKIAADGKVSGEEKKRYGYIMSKLMDIVDAAMELRVSTWEVEHAKN